MVMVFPPPTLWTSTDDMDPIVEDNEDTGVTTSQVQFTDPDDSLPVSARTSVLRSHGAGTRLMVSDNTDEDEDILEDRGGTEMEVAPCTLGLRRMHPHRTRIHPWWTGNSLDAN